MGVFKRHNAWGSARDVPSRGGLRPRQQTGSAALQPHSAAPCSHTVRNSQGPARIQRSKSLIVREGKGGGRGGGG